MAFSYQPATLDGNCGDDEAMLIFRDGKLLAVVSRLGSAHGLLEGQWFVEKTFGGLDERPDQTFTDIPAVEAWVTTERKG